MNILVIIENDIPVFADMPSAMGCKFKKLLAVIARVCRSKGLKQIEKAY